MVGAGIRGDIWARARLADHLETDGAWDALVHRPAARAMLLAQTPSSARREQELRESCTTLARRPHPAPPCQVLFLPWWRRNKRRFNDLFWRYRDIPQEPLATLRRYHESRWACGAPGGWELGGAWAGGAPCGPLLGSDVVTG